MQTGRASRTALRVAQRRAIHQVLDRPCVLTDPIAIPLLGPEFSYNPVREMHTLARAFRAFMAVRSRYCEDRLAAAVANGIEQYVILGAGLDTFAYRNPFPKLRVFEVDFPATQEWKRGLLGSASITVPANLTFVPLDFEQMTLTAGLNAAGFDATRPTFFGWLGVVPYLTLPAFRATLETVAALPAGTSVSFDYGISPHSLNLVHRITLRALARRVAKAGEPFRLLFAPEQLDQEFVRAGFGRSEQLGAAELNDLYFANRSDRLKLPTPGLGRLATAWV
jgi:methyltransferase (TIGR00027 family)